MAQHKHTRPVLGFQTGHLIKQQQNYDGDKVPGTNKN